MQWQCSPYHSNSPLYPVTRELQHSSGIADGDAERGKAQKIRALLGEWRQADETTIALMANMLSVECEEVERLANISEQETLGKHPDRALMDQDGTNWRIESRTVGF